MNKDNNTIKNNNKIKFNINNNNKTESSDFHIKNFNNKTDKKLFVNNFNNSENKKNYYNINKNKINNISCYHKNAKSSQSYIKNNTKKEEIKNCAKKLFYINKNRKTISSYNSHNNSCSKKDRIIKIRNNTRNLELADMVSSKYNNSVTYNINNFNNNKKNYESKSKSKSKSKQKNKKLIKNDCITEPSKHNNKKFFYDSHKNTNLMTNTLINQIKSAQKKTTNKLLNKLNNMNNVNLNISNRNSLFPIFSKAFEKKLETSNDKKKLKNKNEQHTSINKNSSSKQKKKLLIIKVLNQINQIALQKILIL